MLPSPEAAASFQPAAALSDPHHPFRQISTGLFLFVQNQRGCYAEHRTTVGESLLAKG